MNINEAIVATAKKQKECRLAFAKYLFLGILFIIILPVGGGFAVWHLFENRLAPLFFIIIYIPFFQAALMANRGRVTSELGDYKAFYKDVFVRAAIRGTDPNFNYDPFAGISRKEFRKIGIYSPDEFRAEDQISGIYNGVKFSLSEATRIPKRRGAGAKRLGGAKFAIRDNFCMGGDERYTGVQWLGFSLRVLQEI